jgi:hypothetical protein
MQPILSDFSAQALVKAIYANWADYYACASGAPPARSSSIAHI